MNIAKINVGGKPMEFKSSGMTQITYSMLFKGRDFVKDIFSLRELEKNIESDESFSIPPDSLKIFANICYTMRYQALSREEKKKFRLKYPTAFDWLDELDAFSIYEILPVLMDLWDVDSIQTSSLEEKKAKPVEK